MAGLFGFPLFLGMPLCDPDEGVHATIAQEMVEGGDWITPRLLGKPFRDKPILYFWLQAVSLAAFGMNEFAVRLPGMLLAALGVVSTGALAGRLFDPRTGVVAAMVYATTILPTALAQMPVHDIAIVPCVNLAILGFWNAEQSESWRRLFYAAVAGVSLGLAGLAKGLPGVAIVGVGYGLYLVADRGPALFRLVSGCASIQDRQRLARVGATVVTGVIALAIGAIVAVPWYVACEKNDPGYLRYFFVDRHVQGFVSGTQCHGGRPAWYYLPFIVVGGLPAVLYLPALVRAVWLQGLDRPVLLVASWLLGGLTFFSLASSKLVTYIWPLFPAIAILAAVPLGRCLAGSLPDRARRDLSWAIHVACLSGIVVLPFTAWGVQTMAGLHISPLGWGAMVVAAILGLLPLWYWRSGRIAASVATGGVAVTVQLMAFMQVVFAPLACEFSARDLAKHFNATDRVPTQVITMNHPAYSQVFYLRPALRAGLEPDRYAVWLSRDAGRWPAVDPSAIVAIDEIQLKKISKHLDITGLAYERIGGWRIYDASTIVDRASAAGRSGE
ncbi:MAG: glycosyltransferase family 39 protein [Planctomycetia bacterium]